MSLVVSLSKALIIARTLRRTHLVCEDCWYTCPAATEEKDGGECCKGTEDRSCDCGADAHNERVDALVRELESGIIAGLKEWSKVEEEGEGQEL